MKEEENDECPLCGASIEYKDTGEDLLFYCTNCTYEVLVKKEQRHAEKEKKAVKKCPACGSKVGLVNGWRTCTSKKCRLHHDTTTSFILSKRKGEHDT